MSVNITAPNEDYTGEVAGVSFVKGRASVDDLPETSRAYFERHDYKIEESGGQQEAKTDKPAAARKPSPGQ
ncbi:hypothetical protein [Microbispora sp. CA-102843]|uniref:hypothetical protein n=1 Tax=Microbispora sp. CA-102843 TaxID=3239952 RepID=UPI003D8C5E1E